MSLLGSTSISSGTVHAPDAQEDDRLDPFDILVLIEHGLAGLEHVAAAKACADAEDEQRLMWMEPTFDTVDGPVIEDGFVVAAEDLADDLTNLPIPAGERHRRIVQIQDGYVVTTHHSKLSLWIALEGFDPKRLRKEAP